MPGGMSLEGLTVEDCVADGVMVDCSQEASKDNQYLVPLQKLLDWEKEHGRIPDNAAVVFNFDWSKKFVRPKEYTGSKDIGDLFSFKFPAVSEEAGMWLREERNIKMIATDTLTPDPLAGYKKQPIHMKYLKEKRLILENLKATSRQIIRPDPARPDSIRNGHPV
ncbi:uncharacterized protein LOC101853504 [Aplysia californica]|uniref:Uncharacterized protein LOC101853504 n=1 Tax=Aplysia californica TaxID=6500 RepID=A0ABM0K7L9_APLCA|nr:uncharacterized protein LOC101853504 [Aplysia californica]